MVNLTRLILAITFFTYMFICFTCDPLFSLGMFLIFVLLLVAI